MNFGAPPAELVWFVSQRSQSYDTLLYRALAAEYHLAEAFVGRVGPGSLWLSYRFLDERWRPFEAAALALLGSVS